MYRRLLVIAVLIFSVIVFLSLYPLTPKLVSDVEKIDNYSKKPVGLSSARWMRNSQIVVKNERLSPEAASRFYAYTTSVYSDVLNKTGDENQASIATAQITNLLAPKEKIRTNESLKALNNAGDDLNADSLVILNEYVSRFENDGFNVAWDGKLPNPKYKWYPRNNQMDSNPTAGLWKRWILKDEDKFYVPDPPKLGSMKDKLELEKVVAATENRSLSDSNVVYLWNGSPSGRASKKNTSPAGIWQDLLLGEVGEGIGNKKLAEVQKFLAQSIADSFILTWEVKYKYWTQRPSMRINNLNIAVLDPAFPSYVSGHSTISQTAAVVLSYLFPNKANEWQKYSENARNSRLVGGIHFDIDNQVGAYLGNQLGGDIIKKLYGFYPKNKYEIRLSQENDIQLGIELALLKTSDAIKSVENKIITKFSDSFRKLLQITKNKGFENYTTDKIKIQCSEERNLSEKIIVNNGKASSVNNDGAGIVAADFNNDGLIDLFIQCGDYNHLYLNLGDFEFKDVTKEFGIAGVYKRSVGVLSADYNNDGWADILLYGNNTSPMLLKNVKGKFYDVTKDAGLENNSLTVFGAAFGDYNKDGWLDLDLLTYIDENKQSEIPLGPKGEIRIPDETNILLKNNNGIFTNVTKSTHLSTHGLGLAISFLDYNNDGWDDVLIVNDNDFVFLYSNNGNETFTQVNPDLVDNVVHNGMGLAIADYNNDGFLDGYVSNVYSKNDGNLLLINRNGNNFVNLGKQSRTDDGGYGWGAVPIDYNNDGFTDIAEVGGSFSQLGHFNNGKFSWMPRAYLYENKDGKNFKENADELGFLANGSGRGLITADLNNDGYLDLIVNQVNKNSGPIIYKNISKGNNWIKIKLIGSISNRDGIGAKVYVNDGKQNQLQQLETSGTYLSGSEFRLNFGLSKNKLVKEIKVVWPSGKETLLKNVLPNRELIINE